jgi:uncharacterized membrane protein YeaQ/YmgE (transglycosylase-associated protein family)
MNLTLESLIILLIVGTLTGWIAERIMGSRRGLLATAALGFVGAVIGTWAVRQFELPAIWTLHVGHTSFPVVWAIIGAAVVQALLGLRRGRGRWRRWA